MIQFPTSITRFLVLATLALPTLTLASCGADGTGIGAGNGTGAGSGKASLALEDMQWGRLVNVFDLSGDLVQTDVVIRESVQSDGIRYTLSQNPITQVEILTVLLTQGTPAFEEALADARSGLTSLQAKSFDSPGPFTKLARNGAIRLVFSEFLDPTSVDRQTIQVLVGSSEESLSSLEVRYVVKESVGQNGEPVGVVILDPTISKIDSQQLGIPENGIGFPESEDQVTPNIKLRIPTKLNPFINQTLLLTNKAKTQTFDVNRNAAGDSITEPHEFAGLDPVAVRAVRTGNNLDAFNGFLSDTSKPSLIVTQPATIASVTEVGQQRNLVYAMDVLSCRPMSPKVGDVFEVSGSLVQITSVIDSSDNTAYVVQGVLLAGTLPGGSIGVAANLTTRYSVADAAVQLCFLTITPQPTRNFPADGVDPFATISVRFSEPIDVTTVRSLDSMVLSSADTGAASDDNNREWDLASGETIPDFLDRIPGFGSGGGPGRIMFGPLQASGDAQAFTLAPLAGITDAFGESGALQVSLALRNGPTGILDLAGNVVDFSSFVAGHSSQTGVQISMASGPVPTDKYFALRGNGVDEDGDQAPEYAGQLGPIEGDGVLRGRGIIRFSRQADQTNQFVGQRLKFTTGLMTPLTPAGAVLMTCYGYHQLGFGLSSVSEFNLDVEGLNWSPFDGVVVDDTFDRYSVALAHSNRFPDDFINAGSGYPQHQNSGLRRLSGNIFDANIYGFGQDPVLYADLDEVIMFDTNYELSLVNRFQTPGGITMYPWPDFDTTYTWRDTHFPLPNGGTLEGGNSVGSGPTNPGGYGVPPSVVGGIPTWLNGDYPSIALPLLMRFRSYPRGQEFGFNGFQVQIMVGSSNIPAFRVFSSGGREAGGNWKLVRPDLPPEGTAPNGGFNTVTGVATNGFGPELYWGQVDFVTKVSKVYTHWFDFGADLEGMSSLIIEPTAAQASPGTSVEVQFRSTATMNDAGCVGSSPLNDASSFFDAYGEYEGTCATLSSPSDWYSDPAKLIDDGRQFFQLRFTFVSNIEQDLLAELDAFGFAYTTQ
ncbi:MAG: hypothetical protein O3A95_01030 [Planctomycetota bacterium]|nr:hypothetical protein [Planctomycetota bacterium]MDA1112868.1 hypothetical protein [Planctomycetota bacterium]